MIQEDTTSIDAFLDYLDPFLVPQSIQQQLPPSDVVGNIRFTHPTLYVFPGGQGDSALFGINGFNLLVDGGFSRKACFWDFSRHLDRLDAILITRLSDDNAGGMSALLQRKTTSAVYPQIGHVFANLPHSQKLASESGSKDGGEEGVDEDSLLINVIEEGNALLQNLQILNLQPQVCLRDRDNATKPINLYHKVGHGKLDMYVINPSRDAKEIREFMDRWNGENSKAIGTFKSGINVDGKELWLPLANLVSICALLVWFPDNPDDTITRLMFPGSTPQNKVLRGLDKLKDLEFMQKPVCASRSMRQNAQPQQPREKKEAAMKQAMKLPATRPTTAKREPPSSGIASTRDKIEKADSISRKTSTSSRRESERRTAASTTRSSKQENKPTPPSPKRRLEEKALKEQKNQAAGQQSKASSVLKREKPLTSTRPKVAPEKASIKKSSLSSAPPAKTGIPPSKTRKEASNKTKKEEVSRTTRSSQRKKAEGEVKKLKQKKAESAESAGQEQEPSKPESTVMAALAAVVSTAACAAAAVATEPIHQMEEEVESIVEKHQLEEMERAPIDTTASKENEEDDIEPELQLIKDEDDVNEQEVREPDIPVAEVQPVEQVIVKEEVKVLPVVCSKPAPMHVKTPDEVEDLPEHEAVEPEHFPEGEDDDPQEAPQDSCHTEEIEEKIVLDLQEKETTCDKDEHHEEVQQCEASLEAIKVDEATDEPQQVEEQELDGAHLAVETKDILSPESDGAQEQRDMSEMMVSAPQQPAKTVDEETQEEEVVQDDTFKQEVDKLKGVLSTLVAIFEDESKSCSSLNNDEQNLQGEIDSNLEKCITLLSSLNSDATPDIAAFESTSSACSATIELTRKCMKIAIELIEAKADGAKQFMECLHKESDFILNCQAIETYCHKQLPADTSHKSEDDNDSGVEQEQEPATSSPIIELKVQEEAEEQKDDKDKQVDDSGPKLESSENKVPEQNIGETKDEKSESDDKATEVEATNVEATKVEAIKELEATPENNEKDSEPDTKPTVPKEEPSESEVNPTEIDEIEEKHSKSKDEPEPTKSNEDHSDPKDKPVETDEKPTETKEKVLETEETPTEQKVEPTTDEPIENDTKENTAESEAQLTETLKEPSGDEGKTTEIKEESEEPMLETSVDKQSAEPTSEDPVKSNESAPFPPPAEDANSNECTEQEAEPVQESLETTEVKETNDKEESPETKADNTTENKIEIATAETNANQAEAKQEQEPARSVNDSEVPAERIVGKKEPEASEETVEEVTACDKTDAGPSTLANGEKSPTSQAPNASINEREETQQADDSAPKGDEASEAHEKGNKHILFNGHKTTT